MLPFPTTGYSVLALTFCHECWPCVFLGRKLYCLGCVPVKLLQKVAVGIERRSPVEERAFPRLPRVKGLQRQHPSWEAGTLTRGKMSSGYSLGFSLQETRASVCLDSDVPLLAASVTILKRIQSLRPGARHWEEAALAGHPLCGLPQSNWMFLWWVPDVWMSSIPRAHL